MNKKRIHGSALEQIMTDVLTGMAEFTHQSCRYCHAADLEIIGVEKGQTDLPESAVILPFAPVAGKS